MAPVEIEIVAPDGSPAPFVVSLFGAVLRYEWQVARALGRLAAEGWRIK